MIAGNMSHQPFFKKYLSENFNLKNTDFLHKNSFYIGNNPDLNSDDLNLIKSVINTWISILMYKLTIAHGTYENFDKFKITFKSILSELKANKNVQLLILDDSVSDKTQNFIKKYNFKNLKYIKVKKKVLIMHIFG